MAIIYRYRLNDWSNRNQWNVGRDRDHSQTKFAKANLVESRHDCSNVKLLIRPEFTKHTSVRYKGRVRGTLIKASPISQCLITQMSTPWLMESMKLRSESMTQNRRLVKTGIHGQGQASDTAWAHKSSDWCQNPWTKESLASSYGEISPGPEPLIYANLPVKQ